VSYASNNATRRSSAATNYYEFIAFWGVIVVNLAKWSGELGRPVLGYQRLQTSYSCWCATDQPFQRVEITDVAAAVQLWVLWGSVVPRRIWCALGRCLAESRLITGGSQKVGNKK